MKRLIPAVFAGAIVASLIVLLMIELIEVDEPIPPVSAELLSVVTVDPENVDWLSDPRKNLDCDRAKSDFSAMLLGARSCEVDADCTLASFGCPFGCVTSVNKTVVVELQTVGREYQKRCHNCVYDCAAPVFEWRATCIQSQCAVIDRRDSDLGKRTTRSIIDSS